MDDGVPDQPGPPTSPSAAAGPSPSCPPDRSPPAGQAGGQEQAVLERTHAATAKHGDKLAHTRLFQGDHRQRDRERENARGFSCRVV